MQINFKKMTEKYKIEKILKDFFFTDLSLDDATQQMLDLLTGVNERSSKLETENTKLKTIIQNAIEKKD